MPESIKTAVSTVVDAFKTSPSLLFIMLLNVMFVGAIGYFLIQVAERRAVEFKTYMDSANKHYEDLFQLCLKRP
jgi:hypothetical protein